MVMTPRLASKIKQLSVALSSSDSEIFKGNYRLNVKSAYVPFLPPPDVGPTAVSPLQHEGRAAILSLDSSGLAGGVATSDAMEEMANRKN